jgi:serine/threonine protein kinase
MTTVQLEKLLRVVTDTKHVEDIFGDVADTKGLTAAYRQQVKDVHPDLYTTTKMKNLAEEIFKRLGAWRELAEERFRRGIYGKRQAINPIVLRTRVVAYDLVRLIAAGDMCDVYETSNALVAKVTRTPSNNDLALVEFTNLKAINATATPHIPQAIASFDLVQKGTKQRVNILDMPIADTVTLADIIKAHPHGLDPRDMAWMWNRLLTALFTAHEAGYVHGAITPEHILIRPPDHNGVLIDWSYSVKTGKTVKAIVPKYRALYPSEILEKRPVSSATDLFMLAGCIKMLVKTAPPAIEGLLRACLIPSLRHRESDACELFENFGQVLRRLYGAPKFRPFQMPDVAGKPKATK